MEGYHMQIRTLLAWPARQGLRRFLQVLMSACWLAYAVCPLDAGSGQSQPPITRPLVASPNPNYFKDANGAVLTLNGSQTWNTFQDWGSNGSPQPLDFDAFVRFLTAHGHNFTLLWSRGIAKVLRYSDHSGFSAGNDSYPASLAQDRPRQSHRR